MQCKSGLAADSPARRAAHNVLLHAVRHGLVYLSPVMPHLTEELFATLPR